jgi:uncharacterized protein
MMFGRLAKAALLGSLLIGLCLPVRANTTTAEIAGDAAAASASAAEASVAFIPSDAAVTPKQVSIALLLPLRSDTLREAAEVVRAGFQAAYEHEHDSISINIVDTGDTPQDILSGYKLANAQSDIVVGPLSRSGVAAVVQDGVVSKPTIALTPPESLGHTDAETQSRLPQQRLPQQRLPHKMLIIGLSIEDEARQVADWARNNHPDSKALVVLTKTAWQRRAAKAFELQWQQQGLDTEVVELAANDGFLNGRALLQLKKQIQSDHPVVMFLALDARQARQVRAVMGKSVAAYGTSQLNPFALADWHNADRIDEMEATRLLDIPWQLQADHPAVMVYPQLVMSADRKRDADLERLYALGIDAYRVAHEIAMQRTRFELDGVTGKLTVRFDKGNEHFARVVRRAVYRAGGVVPEDAR